MIKMNCFHLTPGSLGQAVITDLHCLAIVDVNPSHFSYDEVSCLGLNIVYFVLVLVVKINFDLIDLVVARVVGVEVAVASSLLNVPGGVVLVRGGGVPRAVVFVVGSRVVNVGLGHVANRVVKVRSRVGLQVLTVRVWSCCGCCTCCGCGCWCGCSLCGQIIVVAVGC